MVWNVLEMRTNVYGRRHFPHLFVFSLFLSSVPRSFGCMPFAIPWMKIHLHRSSNHRRIERAFSNVSKCVRQVDSSCMLKSHSACFLLKNPLKDAFVYLFYFFQTPSLDPSPAHFELWIQSRSWSHSYRTRPSRCRKPSARKKKHIRKMRKSKNNKYLSGFVDIDIVPEIYRWKVYSAQGAIIISHCVSLPSLDLYGKQMKTEIANINIQHTEHLPSCESYK